MHLETREAGVARNTYLSDRAIQSYQIAFNTIYADNTGARQIAVRRAAYVTARIMFDLFDNIAHPDCNEPYSVGLARARARGPNLSCDYSRTIVT